MQEIELRLWILWIAGREYQASILRSPFGLGSQRFEVPESSLLLADDEGGGGEEARDLRRRAAAKEISPLRLLQLQGRELCELVFAGENRDPFKRCCEAAQKQKIWLRLGLTFENAPAAADWPWEALVAVWSGLFLVDEVQVSFERRSGLALAPSPPPIATEGCLQILLIAASPAGLTRLDVLREKSLIARALRKAGVAFKIRSVSSRAELDKAAARKAPYDIVHFSGHGDFDDDGGAIWLGQKNEEGQRMTSPELPSYLRRPAALVILNACHSGRGRHDRFAGLAQALLLAGHGAVVAMRRPISDGGALRLAEELYRLLGAGESVGHALAKWRETSSRDDADWAVPVLYLAGDDFALPMPRVAASIASATPPRPRRRWPWAVAAALLLVAGGGLGYHLWPPPPPCPRPLLVSDPRCPSFAGLELPLVFVPRGTFEQGSAVGAKDEGPVHSATLSRDFCIGAYEVAAGQFAKVMGTSRHLDPWLPEEEVSYEDAQKFARELSRFDPAARCFLPTEAQWEYSARAGLVGEERARDLAGKANCGGGRSATSSCVGSFPSNSWGLYDTRGNVWEWTADWESHYTAAPVVDPQGAVTGESKVRRGGSYRSVAESCRVTSRTAVQIRRRQEAAGFRIACEPLAATMAKK